ncbi:MAG: SRPBCC family protein [Parasphingorhabdus sp.]|uniref:SRPBCC family protein n=1 Tax=Parasphingorhabdus sp. TaxID=2709688 RepID=UPI00300324F1
MTDCNPTKPEDVHELSITRHIAAPPEKVWRVITEQTAQWWCPTPWRTEIIEQDWRSGGRNATVMLGPDGEREEGEGIFLEVKPGQRFVFTDAMTADFEPQGPFMIGIFAIEAEDDGTRYTASARHWTEEAKKQHEEMGFFAGWTAVSDQLAELCENEMADII